MNEIEEKRSVIVEILRKHEVKRASLLIFQNFLKELLSIREKEPK